MIQFLSFHNKVVNIAKIHLFYCMMNNLKSRFVFIEQFENYYFLEKLFNIETI